jgi:DNA-binding transcriptional MerR regulator
MLKPDILKDGKPYKGRLDFRTFTASEVASITGVSTTTQRDWRRRGIERSKKSSGWNRYTFIDLTFYSLAKLLLDRGVTASIAAQLAEEALLRSLQLLVANKDAVQFSPRGRNVWTAKVPTERFIVAAAQDASSTPDTMFEIFGFANFSALNSFFRHNPRAIASVVIDLKRVVDKICELTPKPLLTIVTESLRDT